MLFGWPKGYQPSVRLPMVGNEDMFRDMDEVFLNKKNTYCNKYIGL